MAKSMKTVAEDLLLDMINVILAENAQLGDSGQNGPNAVLLAELVKYNDQENVSTEIRVMKAALERHMKSRLAFLTAVTVLLGVHGDSSQSVLQLVEKEITTDPDSACGVRLVNLAVMDRIEK